MNRKSILMATIIILFIGYVGWLGSIGLRAEEPRRAMVSIEMMESGDYILPKLIGWTYYNKPPLFNWVMIFFFKLFNNTSEWIVRLPSLISFFLMAFFTWKWSKKYINQEIALLASFFVITSADLLMYGSVNTGEIDLFYAFIVFVNITLIYVFLQRKQYFYLFFWSYLFTAIGFLTKGLPSLTFQGFTLLMAVIYFRKFRIIFSWQHLFGIFIFTLLTGGYIYLLYLRGEHMGFIVRQFKEASQRTGLDSNFWNTVVGVIESPAIFLKILMPWTLAIPMILIKSVRKKLLKDQYIVFSLLVLAVNFPLYWITGELRARYIYPLVPFACIVLAYLFYEGVKSTPKISEITHRVMLFLMSLVPITFVIALFVPMLHLKFSTSIIIGLLAVLSAGLIFYLRRDKNTAIYLLFLLMGLARISMNIIYIPLYKAESETTHLKAQVEEVLKTTDQVEISMLGMPHIYDSKINLLGFDLFNYQVSVPPIISYQFPYYYYRKSGKVLKYTQDPKKGNYYIVKDYDKWRYPGKIMYEFNDASIKHNWDLFQFGKE